MDIFVWPDLAIVHGICALPLAWILARAVRGRVGTIPPLVVAAIVLGICVTAWSQRSPTDVMNSLPNFQSGIWKRAALAFVIVFAISLVGTAMMRTPPDAPSSPTRQIAWTGVALCALLAPPAVYAAARCQRDAAKLGELVDQQRIGEAHALAQNLALLDAYLNFREHPLANVSAILEQEVRRLESRVAQPLPIDANDTKRLERARDFAKLGRTDEALDGLTSVDNADADNLRGVIFEARGEWEHGLAAYEKAKFVWRMQPASDAQAAGLTRALTGIGYCQQRSGRYPEAEAAYLELLELAPTADTHFLLAQFYSDAQDADKARVHARRAMTFAPARYRESGEKLLGKLSVYQFGCWRK